MLAHLALQAALTAALAATPAPDPRLALLEAMDREGARAMARLRLDGYDAPYFLSYQVKDVQRQGVTARFGAVTEDLSRQDRRVLVDVRVGSYQLDSSTGRDEDLLLIGSEGPSWSPSRAAPIEDEPRALRNVLWLLTDQKYKQALAAYFRKRSKGVYRPDQGDPTPSFTREPPQRHVDPPAPLTFDRPRWRAEARRLSALFRGHPAVIDATVNVNVDKETRWFTSSEGAALVTEAAFYGVHVQAVARAPDGQLLEDSRDLYARTEAGLPDAARLTAEVQALVAELEALRAAPALDPYTGPAILAPEATGVLFHEALGHRLEGERQDDDQEGQTFKGQLGRPVIPTFLSVLDDPTLRAVGPVALNGAYDFDDQGVPAQRTALVEDGVLRSFLLSRQPVLPFTRSNGHARTQGYRPPVARMANLVVTSRRSVPMAELKRMLIAEARRQGRPFGLILRDIAGGSTNTDSDGYQAFKGTPRLAYRVDLDTGREELVRGVELVGTPLASVNKVMATGEEVRAFNGYCGAQTGYVPVATVAPAALVSEIELQRVAQVKERGPVLPAPWSEEARP